MASGTDSRVATEQHVAAMAGAARVATEQHVAAMAGAARVVVVGLGPAGTDLVPAGAVSAMLGARRSFVRTLWHPAAGAVADEVPGIESFDALYESAASIDQVYAAIIGTLVEAAQRSAEESPLGYVAYAVPGSPLVAERAVVLLREDSRVVVDVVPALSFLDLAWERLGIDPLEAGVRLVNGERFVVEAAGERGPLLVAQCWSKEILSDMKLAVEDPSTTVTVMQRLGCGDESVFGIRWDALDREVEPDHMTSVYVPTLAAPVAGALVQLDELVRTLRDRCPWDRKQTHRSLTKHLIEEAYEVLDAITALPADASGAGGVSSVDDEYAALEEELGDLLFQVLFHARLAAEAGRFTIADVALTTYDKLVGRHPHVFGDVVAETPEAVISNWEQIKKEEKGRTSIMDGVPESLPALGFSYKVQKKAASVGFDWPNCEGPLAKVGEESEELARALEISGPGSAEVEGELGDLLFSVVNLARHAGVDPEVALRRTAGTFRHRFRLMEQEAASRGESLAGLSLDAMDELWDEVKRAAGGMEP